MMFRNEEKLREELTSCLEDMHSRDIISVWNVYEEQNHYEEEIYSMGCLDDILDGLTPTEIVDRCSEVVITDDYFYITIYGFKSFTYIEYSPIDIDELVDYIIQNDDYLGNTDIADILDKYREEEGENE